MTSTFPAKIKEHDPVAECDILWKYRGMVFYDDENKVTQTIISDNCEWKTRKRDDPESYTGWYLISIDENENLHPWMITHHILDYIADHDQADNIEVIKAEEEEEEEEEGSDDDEEVLVTAAI